jgi:hypothetical protein
MRKLEEFINKDDFRYIPDSVKDILYSKYFPIKTDATP